jgi:hypothetical protein
MTKSEILVLPQVPQPRSFEIHLHFTLLPTRRLQPCVLTDACIVFWLLQGLSILTASSAFLSLHSILPLKGEIVRSVSIPEAPGETQPHVLKPHISLSLLSMLRSPFFCCGFQQRCQSPWFQVPYVKWWRVSQPHPPIDFILSLNFL